MCYQRLTIKTLGWIVLALGMASTPSALGNGGPFRLTYPNGDPTAKGVPARIELDLKPGREERLRVVKENLSVLFGRDPERTEGTWGFGTTTNTGLERLGRVTTRSTE